MKKRWMRIDHANGKPLPLKVRRCDTYLCRLRGLMFRSKLRPDEGLLFVEASESRVTTAIHMFFVFCDIAVVWLTSDGTVVDKALAKPFRPYYAPKSPARYYLEGPVELLDWVRVGEKLRLVDL